MTPEQARPPALPLDRGGGEPPGLVTQVKARVTVMLRDGVLDPQGRAIGHALHDLGFGEVGAVRAGKVIELELAGDAEAARDRAEEMARRLLANTVIETYHVEILP